MVKRMSREALVKRFEVLVEDSEFHREMVQCMVERSDYFLGVDEGTVRDILEEIHLRMNETGWGTWVCNLQS